MSAVLCSRCDLLFSSDDDPDCFVELPSYTNTAMPVHPLAKEWPVTIVLCQVCREETGDDDPHGIARTPGSQL